ncbi:Imm50 family immunity protein [Actinokineospora sp. NBRC 105648]|uniref:Imm50 family immunity protein n=1 Tax=Actinokineospora sp. NBRC 105648 TaxID=3032206 RepID=UPI0024A0FB0E|nr:Imm50 family immunity protein [Actinokineospora sp. NBRC 105648]GLZ37632.1 hypothetical protein Acsp05_12570 [Actinokineospora sp. NBRC 105648]
MTPTWADRATPVRSGDLRDLYEQVPDLADVVVHQVRLVRFGPTVSLRLDLPRFPDNPPAEWDGLDRLQCHVRFLAVEDVILTGSALPATASVRLVDQPANRLSVSVTGGVDLTFTSSATLMITRISAYREGDDRHTFLNRLDRRLHTTVPGPDAEVFHDR